MPFDMFDAGVGHSFGIEMDGIVIKSIQQVDGIKLEQDVIELKENTPDGKYMIRQLPGRWKAPKITLTRGLTDDQSFDKWVKQAHFGQMGQARKGASIIAYDYTGAPVRRWKLTNAWVSSLEIGSLKAGDTSVLTEKATIVADSIEVEGS